MEALVEHFADAICIFREAVGQVTRRKFFKSSKLHLLQALEQVSTQRLTYM